MARLDDLLLLESAGKLPANLQKDLDLLRSSGQLDTLLTERQKVEAGAISTPFTQAISGAEERQRIAGQQPPTEAFTTQEAAALQARETGVAETFLVQAGRGFLNLGRGIGAVGPEESPEALEALTERRPGLSMFGNIVGETAPFILPGSAIAKIPSLLPRFAASLGLGATEGAIISSGTGGTVLEGGVFGAGVSGGIELAVPVLRAVARPIFNKIRGVFPSRRLIDKKGQPTTELLKALDSAGLSFDDFKSDAATAVSKLPKNANLEEEIRRLFLVQETGESTAAQTQRTGQAFKEQGRQIREGGEVVDVLARQQEEIAERFNKILSATGGTADDTLNASRHVIAKASVLDAEISELYGAARALGGGKKNIKLDRFIKLLRGSMGTIKGKTISSDRATEGMMNDLILTLKNSAVINEQFKRQGIVDVNFSEKLRTRINSFFDENKSTFRNSKIRELKQALDDDVFKGSGGDLFNEARSAKAKFEADLRAIDIDPADLNKFDQRKKTLVLDLLQNKINPDNLLAEGVLSKSYRAKDLAHLKKYMELGPPEVRAAGQKAWNNLRAESMEFIRENSFKGPFDNQIFDLKGFNASMNRLTPEKARELFTVKELDFLDKMKKVGQLMSKTDKASRGLVRKILGSLNDLRTTIPILDKTMKMLFIDRRGRLAARGTQATQTGLAGRTIPFAVAATTQEDQ